MSRGEPALRPRTDTRFPPLWPRAAAALTIIAVILACLAAHTGAARAQQSALYLPLAVGRPPFATPLGAGFDQVTAVTHAGDDRLFVVERAGRVKTLHLDGRVTLFLDIAAHVLAEPGEYGMYDLAFHPGYADPASPGHGFFYVSYTGRHLGAVRLFISRFRVSADPDAADPGSEAWLMREEQTYSWHKGGALDFDPAGNILYAGLGDDRQPLLAQDVRSPQGKIVRLQVDNVPAAAVGNATAYVDEEVWALGLRNPWRFDVDPPSGQIYIGDVGDLLWEEINLLSLQGRYTNFGWPCLEGSEVIDLFAGYAECDHPGNFALPIHAYAHTGGRCAVIGGKVYRPESNPADGRFIYSDLCSREVFALALVAGAWQSMPLGVLDAPGLLSTLGEDTRGNLIAGTTSPTGPVYRLALP